MNKILYIYIIEEQTSAFKEVRVQEVLRTHVVSGRA